LCDDVPRFGAMALAQPLRQSAFCFAAHVVGWTLHFSDGLTFGIMYLALIGDGTRRHWIWAVVLAVGLELGMLLTPYPSAFAIPITALFVLVTLSAHLIFGLVMGWMTVLLSRRWKLPSV